MPQGGCETPALLNKRVGCETPASASQRHRMFPTFDGHNDILLRLFNAPEKREAIWLTGEGKGHLDLPRMAKGGFVGGFFAIYIPSPHDDDGIDYMQLMENPPFKLPFAPLITATEALPTAMSMAGHMLWMERASEGRSPV